MEGLVAMMKLGLYRSVDIVASLNPTPTIDEMIERARCLARLRRYNEAIRVLDSVPETTRSDEQINRITELRFKCYFANQATCVTKCAPLLPMLEARTVTPKIHAYMAEVYLMQDSTHSPNHPAIPHLLEVLKLHPYAVELAEKMISIGAPIDHILSAIPASPVKLYIESLRHSAVGEFTRANELLSQILQQIDPHPACILNQICLNAFQAGQMDLFDNTARMLPIGDLTTVDLRADRLKKLGKEQELETLVLGALNADENSGNAWLAFSHFMEYNKDVKRALQAVRKALVLDKNSRRGYMRHGELRMQKAEWRKALTTFIRAHQLHEGIDSFTAIIHCHIALGDWSQVVSYAARAAILYPFDGQNGAFSMAMSGISMLVKDQPKAIELFNRALEKDPRCVEALCQLVDIKVKEGDLDGAEELLEKYKETTSESFYWMKMGEVYGVRRDYEKAMDYLSRAVQLDGENVRARELLLQVQRLVSEEGENEEY